MLPASDAQPKATRMKKLTAAQIQNIVFTAIVAIAAVLLYLLAGANRRAVQDAEATPMPTPSPTVSAEPTPTEKPRVVPVEEAAFLEAMSADSHIRMGKKNAHADEYTLVSGDAFTGTAALTFDTNADGRVAAFTLRFARLEKPPDKPKNKSERFDKEMYEVKLGRQNEAIQTLLLAALSAADEADVLTEPVRLNWYTGVLRARDNGKYYSDTYLNCDFLAYPTKLGSDEVIVCSLNIK